MTPVLFGVAAAVLLLVVRRRRRNRHDFEVAASTGTDLLYPTEGVWARDPITGSRDRGGF